MSYCHLENGIGIDLANGFGPLPQAAMRENVATAACLTNKNLWTGNISTAWEDTRNWSCQSIPNILSDVYIVEGSARYPVINSKAVCRSINEADDTKLRITAGNTLTIAGHQ